MKAKNRHNPDRARTVLRDVFARANPPERTKLTPTENAFQKASQVARQLGDEATNISSIAEEDWLEALEADGLDADDIMDVLEDVAAWGVTDE